MDYPSYPVLAPSPAQQPHAHAQMQAQPWGGQAGGMPTGRDFYVDSGYGRDGRPMAAPGYGPADGQHSSEGAYGGGGPLRYGGGGPAADAYGGGGGGGGASYPGEAPYGGGMQGAGAYGYGNAGAPAGDYGATAAPAGAYGHAGGHHGHDDPRRPAEQAYGGAAGLATDFGGLQMPGAGAGGGYAQPASAAAQPQEQCDPSAAWQRAAQAHQGYAASARTPAQNPNPTQYSQPAQPPAPAPQAPAPVAPASWQQYMAPDGRPYFHCRATGASQWDRPASMA